MNKVSEYVCGAVNTFFTGKPRWRGSLILLAVLSLPLLLLWGVVISEYFTCPKDINAEFDRVIAEWRKNAPSQEEVDIVCVKIAREAQRVWNVSHVCDRR